MRFECIHCKSIMDRTNFTDFIRQSDNDKNSIQEAKCNIPDLAVTARRLHS